MPVPGILTGAATPLARAVGALAPPLAFCGVALARDGNAPAFHLATAPNLTAGQATLWRAASLSKVVTGRVMAQVAAARGLDPQGRDRAEALLGWPLRHPSGAPVALGQLASHSAGLTDDAGYLVPAGVRLADWIAAQGAAVWSADPPGTAFRYSNLGYVLLAACAEAASGERFDSLARRLVLAPLGIAGGFNWSGVADRADRLPTFRQQGSRLVPQIDAAVAPAGVSNAAGAEVDLAGYRPGDNPGVFSPQGGLRLSLAGALRLAQSIGPEAPLWQPGDGPVRDDAGGLFQAYGWGVQILPDPPFWPRPLIGHFGNAYGFRGGLWRDPAAGLAFAYALNGAAEGDDDDALSGGELRLLKALVAAAG